MSNLESEELKKRGGNTHLMVSDTNGTDLSWNNCVLAPKHLDEGNTCQLRHCYDATVSSFDRGLLLHLLIYIDAHILIDACMVSCCFSFLFNWLSPVSSFHCTFFLPCVLSSVQNGHSLIHFCDEELWWTLLLIIVQVAVSSVMLVSCSL